MYTSPAVNFGVPGDNQMTDDDGDGIYSITLEVEAGFSSFYTFTTALALTGPAENIAGLPCGDPNNYNDRFLPEVTGDTEVSRSDSAAQTVHVRSSQRYRLRSRST